MGQRPGTLARMCLRPKHPQAPSLPRCGPPIPFHLFTRHHTRDMMLVTLQDASLKASIDKMKDYLQQYLYDCDETEAQVEQLKGRIESCDQEVREFQALQRCKPSAP